MPFYFGELILAPKNPFAKPTTTITHKATAAWLQGVCRVNIRFRRIKKDPEGFFEVALRPLVVIEGK